MLLTAPCTGQVVFVNASAGGLNNGTSWSNAYTHLTTALAAAPAGAEVWVARGVYRPGTTRAATFVLRNELRVYGGLAGDEDPAAFSLHNRDFSANETTLDGTLVAGSPGVHAYHVVTGSHTDASAVLDGFTVTGGIADGLTASRQDVGGGMLLVGGSPTIRHCTFRDNRAGTKGGAIHVHNGSPAFLNCRFLENESTVTQAGANKGGAVYVEATVGSMAAPTFVNCLFSGNRAGVGNGGTGAAVYIAAGAYATFTNCTLVNNVADDHVGGVFGDASITNSILWFNRDRGPVDRSAQLAGGTVLVNYSCVLGWGAADGGNGNLFDDPQFADADYRLGAGSPCVDAGLNEADVDAITPGAQGLPTFDLDGNRRILGVAVDMGAYERCRLDGDCAGGAGCEPGQCDPVGGLCVRLGPACDDGLFCNGVEQCAGDGCAAGTPPCAGSPCDELLDRCVDCLADGDCDDGLFCNGPERCIAGVCVREAAPDCDDGFDCTDDTCDEAGRRCASAPIDARCDDGLFCNGAERCALDIGCAAGAAPCAAPLTCDEDTRSCVTCLGDGDCNDGNPCSVDTCVAGECAAEVMPGCCVDAADCDDGVFCNGTEGCHDSTCEAGAPPCSADEMCDEPGRQCVAPPQCVNHADCDDQNPCTNDLCEAGQCTTAFNQAACDDGNGCTEDDRCANGLCAGSLIPGCGDPPPPPPPPPPPTTGGDEPDSDGDGVPDPEDACPDDPLKIDPGRCGCGIADRDNDDDGVPDCLDQCPGTGGGLDVDDNGCPGMVDVDPAESPEDSAEIPGAPPVEDPIPDRPPATEEPPAPQEIGIGQGEALRPTMCGACGAAGIIGWSVLAMGLCSMRRRFGKPWSSGASQSAKSLAF